MRCSPDMGAPWKVVSAMVQCPPDTGGLQEVGGAMSPKHQCFSGGGGCNVPPTIGLPRRWWVQCPPDTVGLQELVGAISPQHQGSPGGGGCNVPATLGLPARWRVQWSMPP